MSSPDSKEITLVRCLKCMKILSCSRYDTLALLEHIRTDHPEIDIIDTDTKQKRSPPPRRKSCSPSLASTRDHTARNDEIREYRHTDEDCLSQYKDHSAHNEYEYNDHDWPAKPQYVKDVDLSQYSVTSELLEKYPEIKESEFCPHNSNAQVMYTRRYKVYTPSAIASMELLRSPIRRSRYRTSIERWRPGTGNIYCPKCGMSKKPLIKSRAERLTNNECSACCLLSCWPFCFIPWLIPGKNVEFLHCAHCKTFLGIYNPTTNCIKPNHLYVPTVKDNNCMIRYKHSCENMHENQEPDRDCQMELTTNRSDVNVTSSQRLPTITVDGKNLPKETVARIKKYKRYGSILGIDLDDLTDKESPAAEDKEPKETKDKELTPSNTKKDKKTKKKKRSCC